MVGGKEKERTQSGEGEDSAPLHVVKPARVTTTEWLHLREGGGGGGGRVLVGSLPHVTYHIGSSWRLCKLL